jgi:hypothetical protein
MKESTGVKELAGVTKLARVKELISFRNISVETLVFLRHADKRF